MRTSTSLRQFAVLLTFIGCCAGCIYATGSSHSSGNMTLGSRKVQFDADGPARISSAGDVISLNFDGGKLDVEKSPLLLDGQEVATFPENTKVVFATYASGKLTITADGAMIYPSEQADDPPPPGR